MQRCVTKKCAPALRNVPMSRLSESNPLLLRNKVDQNGVINISRVRVMQLTPELGETFYVLGWDEILVKLLSEYVSQSL